MRFCVLASGSSGNASLVEVDGGLVLLDLGLGPKALRRRLDLVGARVEDLRAALLTHTHGDHWNEHLWPVFLERRLILYCHPRHARQLTAVSAGFALVREAGLVRWFEVNSWRLLVPGLRCRAFAVPHDAALTCGFRLEADHEGVTRSLGYAADLGSWDDRIAAALAGVDMLALEFNHDEEMQRTSGRPEQLIERVLGRRGHLSNHQAAQLLAELLARPPDSPPEHLVLLHLSRQCNRRKLARLAAERILAAGAATTAILTSRHNHPGPWLCVRRPGTRRREPVFVQGSLLENAEPLVYS